jgi:hypothetical protein
MGYAHRLSYEHWVGPVSEGLELDHLCRVRSCVNPKHLEPVTRRINQVRGQSSLSPVVNRLVDWFDLEKLVIKTAKTHSALAVAVRKLAKAGGVIQVNAYGGYLIDTAKTPERKQAEEALSKQLGGWEGMNIEQGVQLLKAEQALDHEHPVRHASLDDFFAHFEHILKVVGPEHVGIGLDWDGGGGLSDLPDVSQLPKITAWLLRKGYTEQQIAGIWGGNLLRVMRQAQDYAAKQGG